jgi:hypothetical protein
MNDSVQILSLRYKRGKVIDVETGENRFTVANPLPDVLQIVSNHYFRFKGYQMYHDAGVAVPVFSLRSEDGFGVGEFSDIKKLADWAKETNLGLSRFFLSMIQRPIIPGRILILMLQYLYMLCIHNIFHLKNLIFFTERFS